MNFISPNQRLRRPVAPHHGSDDFFPGKSRDDGEQPETGRSGRSTVFDAARIDHRSTQKLQSPADSDDREAGVASQGIRPAAPPKKAHVAENIFGSRQIG